VTEEVKRIQRVYQITPSDMAMNALLQDGVDSAYSVLSYDRDRFVETFKDKVGGETDAGLIYARSQQIYNTVLNIATSYRIARTAPAIGLDSQDNRAVFLDPAPTGLDVETAAATGVIAYPTLEDLFGELDFCDCEHCRSILSPAAYLADLLLFLDPDDSTWNAFLAKWKRDHGDAPYPFVDQAAWIGAGKPAGTELKPYEVLIQRRPDLPHLALTCVNTNTPLPYIDWSICAGTSSEMIHSKQYKDTTRMSRLHQKSCWQVPSSTANDLMSTQRLVCIVSR
jgi:hypothetical protein